MKWSRVVFVVLFLQACTTSRYQDLPLRLQQRAFGTQPGYHVLSPAFAVEVTKGQMNFYFLRPDGGKELLGVVLAYWNEFSDYGWRELAYAISDDGQRLLFYDERDHPGTVDADLYLFDARSGRRNLIHPRVRRRGGTSSCIEFPRNAIYVGKTIGPGLSAEQHAYTTEGEEISIGDRRAKRLAAGQDECGPL